MAAQSWKIMSRFLSAECMCIIFVEYLWGYLGGGIKAILNELVAWAEGEL